MYLLKTRPMLRAVLCSGMALAMMAGAAGAQTAVEPQDGIDAQAVVQRAVANRLAEDAQHRLMRFLFHKKDDRRDYTQKIIETEQGDVAMAVAVFGKPLGPMGRQAQITRLNNLAAHPELQAHRLKREQADEARVDMLLKLLPDAFVYEYVNTVPCDVRRQPEISVPGIAVAAAQTPPEVAQCYHMTFRPNPKFNPPNLQARILTGMAGEIWIESTDERLYRLRAHLISDVDFGWGFVGRLNKGGTVFLEQSEIEPHVWELTRMRLNLSGKVLMVKALRIHIAEEMGQYAAVPSGLDYREAIRMLKQEAAGAR